MTTPDQHGNPVRVGLALGGGGARGLAHIGVLKALQRENIPIDLIAGTSMGGIIGALQAASVPVSAMEEEVARRATSRRELIRMVDLRLTHGGLLKGARIYSFLAELIGEGRTFADLDLPLAMVATDLQSGCEVVLREGLVVDAVRATISLPGVFEPVETGAYRLVDGGLLNNVPADVVRSMGADFVIAVDVLPCFEANRPGSPPVVAPLRLRGLPENFLALYNATFVMIAALTETRLQQARPDVVLRPDLPEDIGVLLGFDRAVDLIALGEAAAVAAMPQIKQKLAVAARPEARLLDRLARKL